MRAVHGVLRGVVAGGIAKHPGRPWRNDSSGNGPPTSASCAHDGDRVGRFNPQLAAANPSRPRNVFKNLLLAIAATLVALLLGEGAVRAAIYFLHREPIVASDRHAGWKGRPHLNAVEVVVAGMRFRVSTDELGRRVLREPADTIAAPTVVLVGDSYTFGLGVSDSETFQWFLSKQMPNRRFVNLGVPGWGTDQELVNLDDFLNANRGRIISDTVVLVTENDFSDVQRTFDTYLGRRKPIFHAGPGGLETGAFRLNFVDRLMDHSRLTWLVRSKLASLYRLVQIDPAGGEEVVVASLVGIRRLGESRGARLHLFAFRRTRTKSAVSDRTWSSFLNRSGALDMTDSIRVGSGGDPFALDGHWSAEGNRRAARVIRGAL